MKLQLFFSTLILPSIGLELWKCSENLDFKGKILLRNHLFQYMTIKQQIIHGDIQKVCHLICDNNIVILLIFFIPFTCITLCQFYFITSPVLLKKISNYGMRKMKIFVYMAASAYHIIFKEIENLIKLLQTRVCINNTYWQCSGIIIFLCL